MKILHTVESYYPSVGGMQEVVKQLSENLARLGHDVTVATKASPDRTSADFNGVKIREFDVSGNYTFGIKGDVEKYKKFIKNGDYDVITNFAAQQWATDTLFSLLPAIKAKKVFVPTGFSGYYLPEYKNYFKNMKNWMRLYDANVFLSNDYRDINFARKIGLPKSKIIVIPNGASLTEFSKKTAIDIRKMLGISKNSFLILLVGSHTGAKGHKDAIEIFLKTKLKNATLLIAANNFTDGCVKYCERQYKYFNKNPRRFFDGKKLIILDLSRAEVVASYHSSDLFLFPSNVECSPIVLFEACAAKLPFLSTDVGNAKEIIDWTHGGMLLPTVKNVNGQSHAKIRESATMLEKLIADGNLLEKMSESGYESWRNGFTWEKISLKYESLYKSLLC